MKKVTLALLLLITCSNLTHSKPLLTKSKYLISTLYDAATGTVSLGNSTYPLAYNPDRDIETALESDYWVIKSLGNDEYCFQNASTLQYVKYDATTGSDRSALTLVSALQPDKSTSFTLQLKESGNLCYYIIRSCINPLKIWNRRGSAYNSIYPVGVYSGSGSSNEQFIFYDMDGNAVVDDSKKSTSLPSVGRSLGAFSNYADTLTFNKKTPAVDTKKSEFFLSIPEGGLNSNISMNIRFKPKDAAYKLYINNNEITNGANFSFDNVTASDTYALELRNGTSVLASGTLKFTCLPIVQVYSQTTIGSVYMLTKFAVTEPTKPDTTEVTFSSIRTRGATASGQPKKAYAIKLLNVDGISSMDRSFFGLRSDNYWILDAMYIDPARMRNRVSTDLWNDFSTKPYFAASEPAMVNGTRGRFVEVFMNDSYNGLYCMTEKVDRKQLKLKKLKYPNPADSSIVIQRGGLYKGSSWSAGTFLGNTIWDGVTHSMATSYSNNYESWNGFEVKYPDFDDGEPVEWKPLFDGINASSNLTSDDIFRSSIANVYDLPTFLDYYLFIELMLASDNQGKNVYFSVYDQTVSSKLSVAPWDCDGTWGRRWDGSSNVTRANQNFDTFLSTYEHAQNNLFLRLKRLDLDGYSSKLRNRYRELRGTYFAYDKLIARFQNYFELFEKSGALDRESTRWPMYNSMSNEIPFLSNWINQRLAYLDNQYLGGPYLTTGTNEATMNNIACSPNPVRDLLTISNLQAGDKVQLISVQGTIMAQSQANGNRLSIDMSSFAPGVYLIKVGDNVSKVIKK